MMDRSEILRWLRETDRSTLESLWSEADSVRKKSVGDAIHLRGIINFSTSCVRRCTYCGINADNRDLRRYRMTGAEIVACVRPFEQMGLMTVVLQSGEDRQIAPEWVTGLIERIRRETGLAVTLSLGEQKKEVLADWRAAGAERYLLKIETANRELYESMQPDRRNAWLRRMTVVENLRDLGFEVGTGIMIGIPGQTCEMLADDLIFIRDLEPDMIGSGPWIPHPGTSLPAAPPAMTDQAPNDFPMALNTLALTRLLCPESNIPATTALRTVSPSGTGDSGLRCGANVIMPDRTPAEYCHLYTIYPFREHAAATDMTELQNAIRGMGRTVSSDSGISVHYLKRGRNKASVTMGAER